jgi:hypothetical protein
MSATLVDVFQGEWIKRRRSFATLAVIGGSLFTPAIVTLVRLLHPRALPPLYASNTFWPDLWRACWESMAVFFLPLAAILATSLITQIEFRCNAWKQVHTLPVRPTYVFFAKLGVILLMMVEFLVLFSAGVYLCGMLPSWVVPGVAAPRGSFWSLPLLRDSAIYFTHSLPIVAAQYALALRNHNVLVPIGAGFLAWVGGLAAVSSRIALWWPYSYTTIEYVRHTPKGKHFAAFDVLPWFSLAAFALFTILAYTLFVTKREKG